MIRLFAGLAAGALLMTAAPAAPVQAQIQPYYACMMQATIACYPRDENGYIFLPAPETPEGIAYDMCVAAEQAACAGLPGDPNNP